MPGHDHNHAVRRIVLPSGRSVEVVRFDDNTQAPVRQLHICPACASDLVQPHDWSELPGGRWRMMLECPNCSWLEASVYTDVEVELLEEQLDAGVETMIEDLRRLTRANMTTEVDRFVAAIQHDLILPEDF